VVVVVVEEGVAGAVVTDVTGRAGSGSPSHQPNSVLQLPPQYEGPLPQ
jgi:hypothetical protein